MNHMRVNSQDHTPENFTDPPEPDDSDADGGDEDRDFGLDGSNAGHEDSDLKYVGLQLKEPCIIQLNSPGFLSSANPGDSAM